MVSEKSAMEDELLKKIPTESAHGQPAPTASAASGSAIAPTVPDVVQESIAEAHVSPEAAADGTMVGEKRAMEDELLKKVPTENAAGQPGPVASAALSESAPAPTNPQSVTPHATTTQARGTAITTDSVADAATPNDQNIAPISTSANAPAASEEPSSATTPTASKGAKSFPTKSSAPPPTVVEPSTTSNTNMTTAAAPASTPATEQTARQSSDYSREVSPMTMTGHQTTPTVTTGVGSSSTAQQSTPPQAASSPTSGTSASTDKKSKRASGFFGKLKAKFSDKDKDKK